MTLVPWIFGAFCAHRQVHHPLSKVQVQHCVRQAQMFHLRKYNHLPFIWSHLPTFRMRSGKRRKDQTSQLDEMNILNARVDSLETERERLRRQIETMSSQNRHVHSQQWTTEQVADAHADMLRQRWKGWVLWNFQIKKKVTIFKLNVIKSTTRFCQTFDHPIVDSLARCLDDENFVFHLATTVRDLIGTQNTSKDDVYNEAAEVYAETLRYFYFDSPS